MAGNKTGNVVPFMEGWLLWDWFLDDAKDGEDDEKTKGTGKVGPTPDKASGRGS